MMIDGLVCWLGSTLFFDVDRAGCCGRISRCCFCCFRSLAGCNIFTIESAFIIAPSYLKEYAVDIASPTDGLKSHAEVRQGH